MFGQMFDKICLWGAANLVDIRLSKGRMLASRPPQHTNTQRKTHTHTHTHLLPPFLLNLEVRLKATWGPGPEMPSFSAAQRSAGGTSPRSGPVKAFEEGISEPRALDRADTGAPEDWHAVCPAPGLH